MPHLAAIAEAVHGHSPSHLDREGEDYLNHHAYGGPTSEDNSTPGGSPITASRRLPHLKTKFRDSVVPGTPSARTGPPASLNMDYTMPRRQSYFEQSHESVDPNWRSQAPQSRPILRQADTEFRSALEYRDPEQREAEREMMERREKRRHSRLLDGGRRWTADSSKDAKASSDTAHKQPASRQGSRHDGPTDTIVTSHDGTGASTPTTHHDEAGSDAPDGDQHRLVRRSSSLPHIRKRATSKGPGGPKWGRLRSLLPTIVSQGPQAQVAASGAVVPHSVNITDELISGGLSTLMLQLWFDRDERGHRRIPILLHRLRIRISDSLYPLSGHKAVFRIECEYANGAARWVVYRQLRDFLTLHTHYTVSNAYNRFQDNIPDFPRTSTITTTAIEVYGLNTSRSSVLQVPQLAEGRRAGSLRFCQTSARST
jgi:phospholipase D1/2